MGRDLVDDIRAALSSPAEIAHTLGLKGRREGRGVKVLCPSPNHSEKSPSCSLSPGPDRTLRVRCFGCDLAGDVFTLIAAVRDLDPRRDFGRVLAEAGKLCGIDVEHERARERESARAASPPAAPARAALPAIAPPPPPAPRPFPPLGEVRQLWELGRPVAADPLARAWVESRGLDPDEIDRFGLAVALPEGAPCPRWAHYRGDADRPYPWSAIGYRLLVPMLDASGHVRSLRSRLIEPPHPGQPKALPPSGYGAAGLVMGCPEGKALLQCGAFAGHADRRVIITEGEPDFLTWSTRPAPIPRPYAVLGLGGGGGWSEEIAGRIPDGAVVVIRTDHDDAGDRYADEIARTLNGRATIRESDPQGRAERRRARLWKETGRHHA